MRGVISLLAFIRTLVKLNWDITVGEPELRL